MVTHIMQIIVNDTSALYIYLHHKYHCTFYKNIHDNFSRSSKILTTGNTGGIQQSTKCWYSPKCEDSNKQFFLTRFSLRAAKFPIIQAFPRPVVTPQSVLSFTKCLGEVKANCVEILNTLSLVFGHITVLPTYHFCNIQW